jgi:Tol biopolymer transport system component
VLILAASAILLYTLPWVRSGPKRQLVQRDLTANPSDYAVTGAAISPDGKQLAYSDRKNGITLLQIDSGEKRILIGPDMLDVLDWYPDGTHLLIGGEHKGGLWKLSTFDGKKQQVLDENEGVFTAAVSPDGTQIAFVKRPVFNEIWMIGPQGGVPRRIFVKDSKLNVYIHSIAWSPTSRRIIYSWQEIGESGAPIGGISTFNLETGQESAIYSDRNLISQSGATSVSWSSDGRLFFALREPSPNQLDTNLWVLVVDPRTGQVKGAPSRVTNGTGFTQDGLSQSLKEDRLIFEKLKVQHTILIGEIKKQTGDLQNVATLAGDTWSKWDFQWSGDGQSVVYGTYRQGKYVIYRENLRTYEAEELVAPDGTEHIFFPALTSDGRWMFYTRMFDQGTTDTLSELMRIPARGGAPSKVLSGSFSYRCAALTNACVVLEYHGKERSFAQLDPVSGSGPVFARVNDFAYPADRGWSLSADGRRIAYLPTYGSEIKVLSIDGKETTTITVLDSRLQSLSWAPDNTHIYATRASDAGFDVLRVDLDGKFKSLFKVPVNAGWILNPVPSPDGRYLAIPLSTYETNVTLLENF